MLRYVLRSCHFIRKYVNLENMLIVDLYEKIIKTP